MTTTLLILAAVTVAVTALVLALLWVRDRLIDRTGDRFDYGLTPDDAPRDDSDWPPDDPESFEAWMRKKYGLSEETQ